MSGTVALNELVVGDPPASWRDCGFAVEADAFRAGAVRVRLAGEAGGRGLREWALRGLASTELDGLPTRACEGSAVDPAPPHPSGAAEGQAPGSAPPHPNGVAGLDHVVADSSDLDRTIAALERAGLELRRVREEPTPAGAPRQAVFRLGEAILEVVQEPSEATERAGGERPAFFWGLAFAVPDLDAAVAFLGDRVGEPRAAVQPGRRIATLRRSAGLSVPVALITPRPA
jgi:hypothetical protein